MHLYQDELIEVLMTGDYVRETKPYFDTSFGNWLPGDPEDVLNFKVFLSKNVGNKEELLEITKWLTDRQYDRLLTDYTEHCREMSL